MSGISVAFVRPLAELLGRLGESEHAFLSGLGVDAMQPPNAYVGAAELDRALDAIAVRRGDPAFALAIAKASAARPLGLFGHMVWLSGTVGDALDRAAKRYAMVTQRTKLAIAIRGARAIVRSTPTDPGARPGRILAELPFASLAIRTHGATAGVLQLRAVRFAHGGEASAAYADVFRAPVTFGAKHDELELDAAQLSLRLASADPTTSQILEDKVAQLVAAPAQDGFLARVRGAVLARLDVDPSPETIAAALGMSSRTLRRHLEERGLTARAVVDGIRRERADALLAAGASVKEVAFALGFSEPSAFSRAYKRWTGVAPKVAR